MPIDVVARKLTETQGEALVMVELAKLGFLSLQTPRNFPSTDLLAYDPRKHRSIPVQVKTISKGHQFPVVKGLKKLDDQNIFVFVQLVGPRFYVVPRGEINQLLERVRTRGYEEQYGHLPPNPNDALYALDARRELKEFEGKWDCL